MITWIYGNSGAGKTRLAKALQEKYGGILLDADEIRTVWPELKWSKADRWENNLRFARLAKVLDKQQDVIVTTICPYRELRKEVQRITNCKFIRLYGGKTGKEYPFED